MKKFQKLFDLKFSMIKKVGSDPPAPLWKLQSPEHTVNEKVLKMFYLKFGMIKKIGACTNPLHKKFRVQSMW